MMQLENVILVIMIKGIVLKKNILENQQNIVD